MKSDIYILLIAKSTVVLARDLIGPSVEKLLH